MTTDKPTTPRNSLDPLDPRAIDSNPDPITGEPGSHPVGTGLGAGGGAVAEPLLGDGRTYPAAAGAIIGAVAGGLAGKGAAESMNPTAGGVPEQHEVGTGVGASGGALGGAAIGAVGGPVGMAAGAAIGAAAGGMAGKGAGEAVNPTCYGSA